MCGLLAGLAAARMILDSALKGKWVWSVVAAVLAYGVASAVVLCFLADVRCATDSSRHFPQA
jgi:hypothetical protein